MEPADPRYTPLLSSTLQQALAFLENLDTNPVGATKTAKELRSALVKILPDRGLSAEQVIEN